MRIELLNWSGHGNLGDDAMAQILLENIPNTVNMGETYTDYADWYIFGGGTLISPGSLYFNLIKHPEKTIGVSLGVSTNWNGEWMDILKRIHRIYVRDNFSQRRLADFGIPSILSVDLLCAVEPQEKQNRMWIWINAFTPEFPKGDVYFALSPIEDAQCMPNARVYSDFRKLAKDIMSAKCVVASRLHANVIAWMTECPRVYQLSPIGHGDDCKVSHFYERVIGMKPAEARHIIMEHIREIKQITNE